MMESTYLPVNNKPIACPPGSQSVQFWILSAAWDVLFYQVSSQPSVEAEISAGSKGSN